MHTRAPFYVFFSLAVVLAFLTSCGGGGGGSTLPNSTSNGNPATTMGSKRLNATSFSPKGGLDCNGYSAIQKTFRPVMVCTDPSFGHKRAYDNGWYIGHDEPSLAFYSNVPNSANNMQWEFRLNSERPLPATQTFQNTIAFWLGLALCDPNSYPQNPCTPDSDSNVAGNAPNAAGSAYLELQFYPPGFAPIISCNQTQWCASLNIDSLECSFGYTFCNNNCFEPANFAFIQTDGIPAGPPGPGSQTTATFTNNAKTLYMNQNDLVRVTIKDTPEGLLNRVEDLTTGQSGFMVASAANGFENTDLHTCATPTFTFHPEFSTAKTSNLVPWTALQANVNFDVEIGHWESADNDNDDAGCFTVGRTSGCLGADVDFDGNSYLADWPDGSNNTSTSLQVTTVRGNGIGPRTGVSGKSANYAAPYPKVQFETDVAASDSNCNTTTGAGCIVPPHGAAFYPFYSISLPNHRCTLNFGNDIQGQTVEDFGKDAQYGTPNVAWFGGTLSGGLRVNPCP